MISNRLDNQNRAECNHEWIRANYVLTSNPPQYVYVCSRCGVKRTVKGKYANATSFSIVQSGNESIRPLSAIEFLEKELAIKEAENKALFDKVENQRAELAHFNDIFSRVVWEKDPETGALLHMSGSDMLKRIKRAESKAEKWRLFALECEDKAIDFEKTADAWEDACTELEKENSCLRIELTKRSLAAETNKIFKEKYEAIKAVYEDLSEGTASRIFPPVKRED